MKCPVCKLSMLVVEWDGVEIDVCGDCGGVWLDSGELERLLGGEGKARDLLASLHPGEAAGEKPRACPSCGKRMEKARYGRGREVVVDRCRRHHGLWLDKGELEQLYALAGEGGERDRLAHYLGGVLNAEQD